MFPAPTKSGRVESVKSQHRFGTEGFEGHTVCALFASAYHVDETWETGAEAFTIQKIAGHSSAVISQRYVHPTPALIESAFSRFEAYNATKEAELKKEVMQ